MHVDDCHFGEGFLFVKDEFFCCWWNGVAKYNSISDPIIKCDVGVQVVCTFKLPSAIAAYACAYLLGLSKMLR